MERGTCKTLPDELVERIIARVPFPYIFKARGLSKSWLERFSAVSSLNDKAQRCLAIAFQKKVRESSKVWGTFSPVSIDHIAYNSASHIWHRMPSLRNLPWKAKSDLQIVGPLLFASRHQEFRSWPDVRRCRGEVRQRRQIFYDYDDSDFDYDNCPMPHILESPKELYVANMLTRSWKLLPPRPNAALGYVFCETLLINPSSETYMVIAFCRDHSQDGICNGYSSQTYDSKSAAWSSKQLSNTRTLSDGLSSPTYFNGVLYMVRDSIMHTLQAYDVAAKTWKELTLSDSFWSDIEETSCIDLVVCNSNLMMVVGIGYDPVDSLHVLKVDLESLQLSKVARCPPRCLNLRNFKVSRPVSDGRSIFLGYDKSDGRMVAKIVDELIIPFAERKRMRRMKKKMYADEMKRKKKMHYEETKMAKKMNMKMHEDDEEEDEDDEEFDEDDEEFEEDEEDEEEDENDEEDEDPNGEEEAEWICFHSPPDPAMTMIGLRDHEIPNNGQGTKRKRKPKGNHQWCGSTFQPGLNPFMEV